jgi:hypothetical protein
MERWALMRTGRTYQEWAAMARWQRTHTLYMATEEAKHRVRHAQKGLAGLVSALVAKILGV